MTGKQLTHGSFVVERVYGASPVRVFEAFTDPAARRRWLIEGDGWTIHSYVPPSELVAGAREYSRFSPPNAEVVLTNDTVFFEVVRDQRLIFGYAMTLGGAPLSSSLASVQLLPDGAGTRLIFTEQGVYHDGNVAGREEGMRGLLDTLAREIARPMAA